LEQPKKKNKRARKDAETQRFRKGFSLRCLCDFASLRESLLLFCMGRGASKRIRIIIFLATFRGQNFIAAS